MSRILVVEDEPSIAENLVYALETERFEVVQVGTGGEGLEELRQGDFDFVVLDIGLPDMSGFEVCRELRTTSAVPVLFLTARDSEVDRVSGLEMGADDYVTKPFSPREVVARVRAILRRAAAAETQPLGGSTKAKSVGPLSHDEERRTFDIEGGGTLSLTANEYRLLATFFAHPGRVYSRAQLMEAAWEDPGAALERTVDAHIKSLRAKLREAAEGADDLIETRRGMGYALREP